jgi:hypothetical protein
MNERSFRAVLLLAFWLGCAIAVHAAACAGDDIQYNGYRVQYVTIWTPIGFFAAATFGFDTLKAQLPLQEGQAFSVRKLSDGNVLVKEHIKALGAGGDQKFKFVVVTGHPTDCDVGARTLNVAYPVFTNVYRPSLSSTFEQRQAEVQRPSTASAEGGAGGRYLITPLAGYNAARRISGGVNLVSQIPSGIFQHLQVRSTASTNSLLGDLAAGGTLNSKHTAIAHADWQLGYHYLDLPAGSAKLKEGTLGAQFIASTKELGKSGTLLRYGASLDGGHQQTELGHLSLGLAPDTRYGALKLYLGATGRCDHQAFSASYGVELGSTLRDGLLDFTKHVADVGYSVRFLAEPTPGQNTVPSGDMHKPLDIELRLSAGIIQNGSQAPAPERFFGGNQIQPFMAGDAWVIPEGAYIRSLPENRFGAVGGGALGGSRFYSGNLTVAKVLWGRPLLPKELAHDPQFLPELRGAIETVKGDLTDYYKSNDPAYASARSELDAVGNEVQQLITELAGIPSATANIPAIAASLHTIRLHLPTVSRILVAVRNGDNKQLTALTDRQMPNLETITANLEQQLTAAGSPAIATAVRATLAAMEGSRTKIKSALAAVNTKAAQARADQEFSTAQKVLNAFLYELNIYSIAPVGIFDVARVWPANMATRYAVGGGARLSLVNVNFTIAYAANPKRQPGEGAGALFVKLDVSDLFH